MSIFLQTEYLSMLGFTAPSAASKLPWVTTMGIVLGAAAVTLLAGLAIYKWRMRQAMQSEIQSIM